MSQINMNCHACRVESGRLKAPFLPKHTCLKGNKQFVSKCPKCNGNIIENDGDLICEKCKYCIEPSPISAELYDIFKDINSNADLLPFP